MADRKKGTPSKYHAANQAANNNGKPHHASSPTSNGPNTAAVAIAAQAAALNPPFDTRMRRVGSPLNLAAKMKRGWLQNAAGTERVNFLFNPAAIDIASTVNANVQNPLQKNMQDVMQADYVAMGSSTGVSLLFDRTYELFSQPAPTTSSAPIFGAYADIVAFYKFLKMVDAVPNSWSGTLFSSPMLMVPSYLFVGPSLYFYGFVNQFSTTITHWSQNMIPQRAKVDIGFTILPVLGGVPGVIHDDGSTDTAVANPITALQGWASGLFGNGVSAEDDSSDDQAFVGAGVR